MGTTRFRHARRTAAFAVAGLALSFTAAHAADVGSVNPSRAGERLKPQQEAPTVGAPIEIPSTPQQQAPEGASTHRFTLTGVTFEGNVALPNDELQGIAKDYIGKEISLAQVFEMAGRVTAAYRSHGYILARAIVPTQKISDGLLQIRIVEGFIDKVTVEGDAGGARSMLEEHGRRIAAVRPLTAATLERELLLAQDLAGFQIRSVLTPSSTTPGAADLTLLVERHPYNAYLGIDNRGSKYLGPIEITAAAYANDIFGTAGQLGLTAVATPQGGPEVAFGAISYDLPITSSGLRLYSVLSHTRTEPGATLKTLNTTGQATTFEATLSYPFIRSRDLNVIAQGGLTSRDSKSTDDLVSPLFNDHIRSINAGVYLNALDTWGGYSTLSASVTQGLHVFGASDMSDPNRSRTNADGTFHRVNFEASHLQPLIPDVNLLVGALGQTSFGDSLLSSEQIGLGGLVYGRGYDPSEITGDRGLAGKAELQWNAIDNAAFLSGIQFYTFYEGGAVWLVQPLPGEQKRESLASAGLGVRLSAWERARVSLEFAQPLTRDVAAEGDDDGRVYFSLGMSF
jgi:hemolysin activation/secretion protein